VEERVLVLEGYARAHRHRQHVGREGLLPLHHGAGAAGAGLGRLAVGAAQGDDGAAGPFSPPETVPLTVSVAGGAGVALTSGSGPSRLRRLLFLDRRRGRFTAGALAGLDANGRTSDASCGSILGSLSSSSKRRAASAKSPLSSQLPAADEIENKILALGRRLQLQVVGVFTARAAASLRQPLGRRAEALPFASAPAATSSAVAASRKPTAASRLVTTSTPPRK